MIYIIIPIVIIVLLAFWLMGMYNGLVKSRNRYKNAFAQIDVQLKRRHDQRLHEARERDARSCDQGS